MQPDLNKLKALAELDDNRFSAMLYVAATAVGLPAEQAKEAAAHAAQFKQILKNASGEELAQLQKQLKGNPSDLLRGLGGERHD